MQTLVEAFTILTLLIAIAAVAAGIYSWVAGRRSRSDGGSRSQSEGEQGRLLTDAEVARELTPTSSEPDQQQDSWPLPDFGSTKIVAMVRDPNCVFAYWEISRENSEEIRQRYGSDIWEQSQVVLRLFDATNHYHPDNELAAEITVSGNAHSWYISCNRPHHTLFIELGLRLPDNRYISLARSNLVQTPRADASEIADQDWLLGADAELYHRCGQPGDSSSLETASPTHWQ